MKTLLTIAALAAALAVTACGNERDEQAGANAMANELDVLEAAAANLQEASDNAVSESAAEALQNQAEVVSSVAANQADLIENANTNGQ